MGIGARAGAAGSCLVNDRVCTCQRPSWAQVSVPWDSCMSVVCDFCADILEGMCGHGRQCPGPGVHEWLCGTGGHCAEVAQGSVQAWPHLPQTE